MKSFLLKSGHPIVKFSLVPNNCFYEGNIPEGFDLAVCPSGNIVILDVDVKNGKNGFNFIPSDIYFEIRETFNYKTGSGGAHYFIEYTGNKILKNCATQYGLDLRIGAKGKNSGGYVRYQHNVDIRQCLHLIKQSSSQLNLWLEKLFSANIEENG